MKYENKNNGNKLYPITFGERIIYGINKVLTNPVGFGVAVHLISAAANSSNLETFVNGLISPQATGQSAVAGAMWYVIRGYDKIYHRNVDLKERVERCR